MSTTLDTEKTADSTHPHEQPANEHEVTATVAEKSTKCPFFQKDHGGCPFDPSHPHSFDLSKIKECPAFKDGCPYKDVHLDKLKDCPAFKDGKCPFDGNHNIDLSRLKECPAFKNGCPYESLHAHHSVAHSHANMNTHQVTQDVAAQASKCPFFSQKHCPFDPAHPHAMDLSKIKECPSFKSGCPFKDANPEKLKECPAFKDGKCPFDGKQTIDLSRLKECPAFKNGCPYSHAHESKEGHSDNKSETDDKKRKMEDANESGQGAAKCPFAHAHGQMDNPHEKK